MYVHPSHNVHIPKPTTPEIGEPSLVVTMTIGAQHRGGGVGDQWR